MIKYCIYEENNTIVNEVLSFPLEKIDYPINKVTRFCPALKSNEQFWVIRSPYTYHLKHSFTTNGESTITVLPRSSFTDGVFEKLIEIFPKERRNRKDIPTLQFFMSYIFFTEKKDVNIEVFPAFMNHELNKQPIVSIHGSYPVSDWIRPMNFAFDWVEPSKEIYIERGTPLMYIRFTPDYKIQKVPFTIIQNTATNPCLWTYS
jgi:hypothetical protein